jgi:hypothetical protein
VIRVVREGRPATPAYEVSPSRVRLGDGCMLRSVGQRFGSNLVWTAEVMVSIDYRAVRCNESYFVARAFLAGFTAFLFPAWMNS